MSRILDAIHELRIRYHKARMMSAECARRAHHDEFVRLAKIRSAKQVLRMERKRGLS